MIYWIIGVAVVLILLAIWIGIANKNNGNNDKVNDGTQTENNITTENNTAGQDNVTTENNTASQDNTTTGNNTDNQDVNLTNYLNEQNAIMENMMVSMENVQGTGNAAVDFLYGMIPHHESAIDMAESLLKYGGQNEEIKTIAENIIVTQSEEIQQMQSLISDFEESLDVDTQKEEAYLQDYNNMIHSNMSHNMNTFGSVDEAFADGMIMHHQMAVDMSNAILKYTDYENIKELAQNIINIQQKEIQQMQEILDNIKQS